MPAGRPRNYNSAKELKIKVDEYFNNVAKEKEIYINEKTGIPTIIKTPAYYGSLLLHCGLFYSTAEPYENGDYDDDNNKFSEVLTYARMMCEKDLAENGIKGIYNPKVTESALQRHHDFVKNQKIESKNVNLNTEMTLDEAEEIIKKFEKK